MILRIGFVFSTHTNDYRTDHHRCVCVCVREKRDNRGRVQCAHNKRNHFCGHKILFIKIFYCINVEVVDYRLHFSSYVCVSVQSYVCDMCTVLYGAASLKMHFIHFLFLFFFLAFLQ